MNLIQLLKKTWNLNETEDKTYPVNIPDFPGFYESILEFPTDDELYFIEEKYGEFSPEISDKFWDCIDYRGYEKEIGRKYLEAYQDRIWAIAEFMKGFTFEFVGIDSPREYNFTTDKLAVNLKAESESIQFLVHYCINQHRTQFDKYLKDNFTSYDGFWSFWPNNTGDWWGKMRDEALSAADLGFMIMQMIHFVLEYSWEGIEEIYYELSQDSLDGVYASEFIDWEKFEKETRLKLKE